MLSLFSYNSIRYVNLLTFGRTGFEILNLSHSTLHAELGLAAKPIVLYYSFKSFVSPVLVFLCVGTVCVFLYLFLCFPDIYLSPSSSPFCFWPGLSLLHSHCIQQILESVNHCHINGIVHRDLKVSK